MDDGMRGDEQTFGIPTLLCLELDEGDHLCLALSCEGSAEPILLDDRMRVG